MGLLDILLGRSKPVAPDLDQLFALPSAAITLQAAAGFTPTGTGAVCFATVEGAAFAEAHKECPGAAGRGRRAEGPPVEVSRDEYGYSWLVSRREPDDLPALVSDLHAVNSALEGSGFGPQLLCSVASFQGADQRRLGLVYLYKRGTFYPFAPLAGGGQQRNNALELQIKAALADDLRIEQDLSRWFPIWGAPGL